jgi:transposase
MKKAVLVGIDVSADELVVAVEREGQSLPVATFDNDATGHRKLIRWLTKSGRPVRVCLEATGVYGLELSLALSRAKQVEVMVANPRTIKDFARAFLQRSKTDDLDAKAILEFVKRMPFRAWQAPPVEILQLRAVSRRISALTKNMTMEKNRLHASDHCEELTKFTRDDIASHIEYLQESIRRLGAEAVAVIRQSPQLSREFDHLVSVKGIAEASATRILAELSVLPGDMTARQWVAHAGLDPRHHESGSSIHRPARVTKAGNKHLRSALYMPALVAIQHEPNVRAFYEKLLARGKKPLQAIVAVMRKLLHAIYGMLRHDQDFEGEKFFAMGA